MFSRNLLGERVVIFVVFILSISFCVLDGCFGLSVMKSNESL